jgi:hypothetical protein
MALEPHQAAALHAVTTGQVTESRNWAETVALELAVGHVSTSQSFRKRGLASSAIRSVQG